MSLRTDVAFFCGTVFKKITRFFNIGYNVLVVNVLCLYL